MEKLQADLESAGPIPPPASAAAVRAGGLPDDSYGSMESLLMLSLGYRLREAGIVVVGDQSILPTVSEPVGERTYSCQRLSYNLSRCSGDIRNPSSRSHEFGVTGDAYEPHDQNANGRSVQPSDRTIGRVEGQPGDQSRDSGPQGFAAMVSTAGRISPS
jgi:hypothetical protein